MNPLHRFKQQSYGDQNRIIIIILLVIFSLYFGLRYPGLNEDVESELNLINRQQNRIETRITKVDSTGLPINKLKRDLKTLEDAILAKQQMLTDHAAGFASLEDPKDIRLLKLEMSKLAQRSGFSIVKMNNKIPRHIAADPKLAYDLTAQADNAYGRPLVTLEARTEFSKLLLFLEGLKRLPFKTSTIQITLDAITEGDDEFQPVTAPLNVTLLLTL